MSGERRDTLMAKQTLESILRAMPFSVLLTLRISTPVGGNRTDQNSHSEEQQ